MATRRLNRLFNFVTEKNVNGKLRRRGLTVSSSQKNSTGEPFARVCANGAEVVDVSDVACTMREEVRRYTRKLENPVRLAGVLAETGHMEASQLYAERIAETLAEDFIDFELATCKADEPSDVSKVIQHLNERNDIHGILVFYPIFQSRSSDERGPYLDESTGVFYKSDDDWIRDMVTASKDVEGLGSSIANSRMFRTRTEADQFYVPCTAMAVMEILHARFGKKFNQDTVVTIVNRSEIFGRPLAALIAQEGAHVFSVDESSVLEFKPDGRSLRRTGITLEQCIGRSSIIISGVPSCTFQLPVRSIVPGSVVVDVSESTNVDEDELLRIPGVKFVPRVGKVTIAALETNLVRLHEKAKKAKVQHSD